MTSADASNGPGFDDSMPAGAFGQQHGARVIDGDGEAGRDLDVGVRAVRAGDVLGDADNACVHFCARRFRDRADRTEESSGFRNDVVRRAAFDFCNGDDDGIEDIVLARHQRL